MITPDLMNQLGLQDSANDEAFVMAIKTVAENAAKVPKLQSRITELETQNTTLKEDKDKLETAATASADKEVTNALAAALKEGRTTVELNAQLQEDYKGRPEPLNKILASLKPFKTIITNTDSSTDAKTYEGKNFDDLYDSGDLEKVKNKLPELYNTLYKEKFNKEPKEK